MRLLLATAAIFLLPTTSWAESKSISDNLNCTDVRTVMKDFLQVHYSAKTVDKDISQKTMAQFLKKLDRHRLVFTNQEVRTLENAHDKKIKQILLGDCSFLIEIKTKYSKNLALWENKVPTLTRAKSSENSLKEKTWATSLSELQERWETLAGKRKFMLSLDGEKNLEDALKIKLQYKMVSMADVTNDKLFSTYLDAFAQTLDPHSRFLNAERKIELDIRDSLSFVGVGINLKEIEDEIFVDSLVSGGSAEKDARILPGDKIIEIKSASENPHMLTLTKASQLLRGKANSQVALTLIRREGDSPKRIQVSLKRQEIHLADEEAQSKIIEIRGTKIGVVTLPSFYLDTYCERKGGECRSSAKDTEREIKKLMAANVEGIVLDLRTNPGGNLTESIKIAGMFLNDVPVVQVRGRTGQVSAEYDSYPGILYGGPLAVLIGEESASASEILAGAIQDYGRGIIFGSSPSFGKGTVQAVTDYPSFPWNYSRKNLGSEIITIAKFYQPSGKSNQSLGVVPDITLPKKLEKSKTPYGKEKDEENAFGHDSIAPHKEFAPLRNLKPVILDLARRQGTETFLAHLDDELSRTAQLFEFAIENLQSKLALREAFLLDAQN